MDALLVVRLKGNGLERYQWRILVAPPISVFLGLGGEREKGGIRDVLSRRAYAEESHRARTLISRNESGLG